MKKRSLLITALLLCSIMSFAQIKGGKIIIKKPSRGKSYTLTVMSNVKPYTVLINGRRINGNRIFLPAGNHNVTVQANGYSEYRTTINLNRNMVINTVLNPFRQVKSKIAYVSVYIPENLINSSVHGALNQIRIFDNGRLTNGFNFEVKPGNHTIRIESGGLVIEGSYYFESGESYSIEPVMYLNLE